jgi:hypothetical protein
MMTKLTRLTHKIAIQLHLVAESCTICSSRSGGQSGNFWIHFLMPRHSVLSVLFKFVKYTSSKSEYKVPHNIMTVWQRISKQKKCLLTFSFFHIRRHATECVLLRYKFIHIPSLYLVMCELVNLWYKHTKTIPVCNCFSM